MTSRAEREARLAANRFREDHGLGVQPLGDLVEIIERAIGVDVAVLEADGGEHGMTMRDPLRDTVFIGVARSRHPMRQRSTLAHELGHFIFKDWERATEYGERSFEEVRADAFARHLLAPVAGIRELLGEIRPMSESALSAVVQRFLVSPAISAIVMRDVGYISQATASTWMSIPTSQLATRHGWSDHYISLQAESNRLRAPQALVARAVSGYVEGVVNAQTIATLRGIPVDTILAEFAEAGISPRMSHPVDVDVESLPDVDIDLSDLGSESDLS